MAGRAARTSAMRRTPLFVLALLSAACLSCAGRSAAPTAPVADSQLEVFVQWQGHGVADVRLDLIEPGLTRTTDAMGIARFEIPAGTYTLRAHVNGPGPGIPRDIRVTTRAGGTERLEVTDCLPCVSP